MGHQNKLSRRRFMVSAVGGGMAIMVSQDVLAANTSLNPWDDNTVGKGTVELSAWLTIGADDVVTIRSPTPEIGNGVMTQAAMTVAEELNCDWSKVATEFASASRDHLAGGLYRTDTYLTFFGGRSTTKKRNELYLQAGASARERLKAAAAARWNVPVTEIDAKDSKLTHKASGRTLRYGEVAAEAAKIKLKEEPKPKPQSEWTLLGKASPSKLHIPLVVKGAATYGIDVRPAGMAYAALRQSPVHGGKLKSYDANAVKNMPGVLAVVTVDPDEPRGMPNRKDEAPFTLFNTKPQHAVAVIAEHYWQARKALDALPVEWDDGPGAQWKSTEQINQAAFAVLDKETDKPKWTTGDISGLDKQKKIVEATYLTPYCDQACMEPLNGTALVTKDKVEMWHPSQSPQQTLWIAADEARVDVDNVTINQTYVGGGFGRRIYGNDARMVVAVAKKFPGRPVQVIWSREEMTRQGRYRDLIAAKMKAGLDEKGMPQVLVVRASGGPAAADVGMMQSPYLQKLIPNTRYDLHELPLHIQTGPYRGPGYNSFSFVMETFIDECAHAAGVDPLEYRLKMLAQWPDEGWTKILKEVSTQAGWGKKLPKGFGQGIAIANWGSFKGEPHEGTTVGVVATVEVTSRGNAKVHTLDVAFDTGRIMNRDAIHTEVVGGVIFGYNMSMNEGLTVKDGRIVEGNFSDYPMVRIGDVPQINVHFGGLTGHDRFSEIGEPPIGPVGPAIGNAIFKASGKRLRTTPFRNSELSWV